MNNSQHRQQIRDKRTIAGILGLHNAAPSHAPEKSPETPKNGFQDTFDTADVDAATLHRMVTDRMNKQEKS